MNNKKSQPLTKETVENIRDKFSELWLSQSGFEDLLNESGFVSKVIEHYRVELFERWQRQPWNKGKDTAGIENHIENISKALQEHLGRRLYYTTALLIDQSWRDAHERPMSKATARMLANVYFVESGLTGLRLRDSRGRTRKVVLDATENLIKKAVLSFKEKNEGKTPTLTQTAKIMKITTPALKMRINREGLNWKELRKVTK